MITIDEVDRLVLDFYCCAMLPLSPDALDTGHDDDLSSVGADLPPAPDPTAHWDAPRFSGTACPALHFDPGLAGTVPRSTADVVSSAPRVGPGWTLNIAATHHDSRVGGQRLV